MSNPLPKNAKVISHHESLNITADQCGNGKESKISLTFSRGGCCGGKCKPDNENVLSQFDKLFKRHLESTKE